MSPTGPDPAGEPATARPGETTDPLPARPGAAGEAATASPSEFIRADMDPFALDVPVGTLPVASGPFLQTGQILLWHFRRHDFPDHRTEVVQPVRVVAHDERGLVVWLHGGTQTAESRLAGWEDVNPHDVPYDVRFGPNPPGRVQVPGSWYGTGVLRIIPAGSPFSVWVFRDGQGNHQAWYINLEQRHRLLSSPGTAPGGLYTADHILDIVIDPAGGTRFKDEDELAGALEHGMWSAKVVDRIRQNSQLALSALRDPHDSAHWAFGSEWTQWREPAGWGALGPELVQNWLT